MYYTVAYPAIGADDLEFIRGFRGEHDAPYRDVVEAHFTLVFGCDRLAEAEYLKHLETVARGTDPISFRCRYAMLGADAEDETAYVFLVPDEGYGRISLLHDALYAGPLAPYLRLDIPFTPHINIGTLERREEAKQLCDQLNRKGVDISGKVDSITLGKLEGGMFRDVASFALKG